MTFPATMPVKQLDAKHPDWIIYNQAWEDLSLLYQGGQILKKRAENFLTKRPKELAEVYAQRIQRFTYQNVIGSALGWYQAAMFCDDPDVQVKGADQADTGDFYIGFLADCDRAGSTYVDFWRRVFLSMLLFRSALVLVDLPKPSGAESQPSSLADQKATGALDPYVVLYDPRAAVNWECDGYGNLVWINFAVTAEQRDFLAGRKILDRWYYFDRQQYAVYEAQRVEPSNGQRVSLQNPDALYIDAEKPEHARLIDSGPHALAEADRVPVRWIQVPDGLWMGNRAYLHALSHLNMQNAYFWGLFMGCLPTLYIKGEYQTSPTISETGYIQIAENGDIGYIEPAGKSYEIASKELATLREEMYRAMYLQAQGRTSSASASASSGYSKEMDMAPSRDVLNGLGDIMRAGMRNVLEDIATIRGDAGTRTFEIRGFDFDDHDEAGELATAQLASDLAIPSDTLEKELQKKTARTLLKDATSELIQKVEREIDSAPTQSQRAAQQQDMQQQRIAGALQTGLGRFESRTAVGEMTE